MMLIIKVLHCHTICKLLQTWIEYIVIVYFCAFEEPNVMYLHIIIRVFWFFYTSLKHVANIMIR